MADLQNPGGDAEPPLTDAAQPTPAGAKPAKPRSLTDRTLSGFFWAFCGTVGQQLLQFAVVVVLARLLTPHDYGTVSAAMVVIGFSQIFSQLGIGPAIVQRPGLETVHVTTGFALSIIFGLLTCGVIFAAAPLIAAFFHNEHLVPIVRVLAFGFPLEALSVVNRSLLQREMRFRALSSVEVTSYFVGYGCIGIALAWFGFGAWSLVIASLGQVVTRSVLLLFVVRHRISLWIQRAAAGQLIHFGFGFSLARIGNYFALQGDNMVVGRWLGPEALGMYGRAYQLLAIPTNLFGTVIDQVLFPAMASVQDDKERLRRVYMRSVAVVAMVTLPLSSVLVVIAPELISLLLGPNWTGVVLPFQILVTSLVFRAGYKMSDSLVRATGFVYHRAWRQWVYAACVIAGAWIGHFSGTSGVAVGVIAAIATNFLLMLHLSNKITKVSWTKIGLIHLRHLAIAVGLGLPVWAMATFARVEAWPGLIVLVSSGAVALATGAAFILLMPRLFGEEGTWVWSLAASRLAKIPARIKR